ncbi:ClcB-like voltage-gated chloride channel protein [Pigmentiphaga soli]|uniref:ClcB-like voltage-gated chloride channel protein n=1 Tax=Pigmentiphaga soli TaxID=1007095 RepID=A0ABP8H0C9_9BURK
MVLFQRQLASIYLRGLALAVLCGILGALAAQFFRWATDAASELLFDSAADITGILAHVSWQTRLLVPAAGGAIAGAILLLARRYERQGGPPVDYLEIIDSRVGRIPVAASLLRCLSSFFSIVSGGSVGKEGAMVQLSATAASALAGRLGGGDGERTQLIIAMAATGGLAAVYHTPLAAAIFIAEIAFGGLELWRIGFLFAAAVAATWVVSLMGQYTPLYALPPYHFDVQGEAMIAVIAVGIAAGAVGAAFLASIRVSRSLFARLPGSVLARMTAGGLIVGAVLIAAPDVAGNGFAPLSRLLSGAPLAEPLLVLLVLKIVATAATVGAGAIGGLFTPSLLLGALVGVAGAPLLAHYLGLPEIAVVLGVAGMAASLAAATQAPLMSTLMVFEMTQEPTFIFPIMLATVVAYVTSNMLGQTGMYAVIARHRARFASRNSLYDATVRRLMRPADRLVPSDATPAAAREAGMAHKNRFVFLVGPGQVFAGTVSMHDLMSLPASAAGAALADMADTAFPVVYADQKVVEAWETVIASPAERTPVLSDAQERKVIGFLQKSDLLKEARHLLP